MKRSWLLLVAIVLATIPSAFSAGLAHNDNFIVMAPDQPLADQVLAQADYFRTSVALDWFGAEMPAGEGRAIIHLELSNTRDLGLTWPMDSPNRKFHRVWLVTSADRALGSTLHHEIAHVLLATRYPNRLPWWADEGIASRYDDDHRKETRDRILARFMQSGHWPHVESILGGSTFAPDDEEAYAVAVSITEYLLTRGNRPTFLAFAEDGQRAGWTNALQEHYGLASLHDLEIQWRTWLHRRRATIRNLGTLPAVGDPSTRP